MGGAPVNLCRVEAKAILMVNTASQCGYTPQYEGLEQLHKKYQKLGLMVVAVPANDFGGQESGGNAKIAEFCKLNYGVSFTVGEKLEVPIGSDPIYKKLIAASGEKPKWNFHKYLVAKGQIKSYDSDVTPMGKELTAAVEAALK